MKHPTARACVGCLFSLLQQIISSSSDKAVVVASDHHYTIVGVNCFIASVPNPENAPDLSPVSTLPPSSTSLSTLYSSVLSRASAAPLTFSLSSPQHFNCSVTLLFLYPCLVFLPFVLCVIQLSHLLLQSIARSPRAEIDACL